MFFGVEAYFWLDGLWTQSIFGGLIYLLLLIFFLVIQACFFRSSDDIAFMLFVSKIGKQLFGGKFCFPPKFFCFEIWTEHVEDGFREAFIFNRKGKRNFNLTFIFESSTYPSYTFHPHFFANLKKWGRKQFFSRFLNLAFSLLQSLRMVPLDPSESSTTP